MNTDNTPKLGGAFWLLKGASLPDLARWMAENSFSCLSLHPFIMRRDKQECLDLAATIRDLGLSLTFHGNIIKETRIKGSLDYNSLNRQIDEAVWWHENASAITCLCFDSIHFDPAGFAWEWNREMVLHATERLKPYGIKTGIENVFGEKENYQSLGQIQLFKDQCNLPDMGILLDTGHANIHVHSGVDPEVGDISTYLNNLTLEILEVHLQDNRGKQDEHKYLGYGKLDLISLLKALKAKRYIGPITIEVCKDILSGQYQLDITNVAEADLWLKSRDILLGAWEKLLK